jgi:putative ABC transport system permease protein
MNGRFLFREILHSRSQGAIFVLCVALSLVSIVAINSFRRDVRESIVNDARSLHGGDIIIHSHYPLSPALSKELALLEQREGIDEVRSWEFYSVARREDGRDSLFSNIKAVTSGYPLYGAVELRSGQELQTVLRSGRTVVAQSLLERLDLEKGDRLLLGNAVFEIADVIVRESVRPVDFFNIGPRIIVPAADLDRMGLVKKGSRVHYESLLRIGDEQLVDGIAESLTENAIVGQEQVATYETKSSRVKRFFDNLFFFLSLISVFTLLLAGIGMQSSLAALFRRKENSIAIVRSLGGTDRFLLNHYLLLVAILSGIGMSLGIVAGLLVEKSFVYLFSGLLPPNIIPGGSIGDVLEGILLGIVVVSFFTCLPLARMRNIRPVAVFRKDNGAPTGRKSMYILIACGIVLLSGLVVRQLEDVRYGIYFIAGVIALVVVISLLVGGLFSCLSRLTIRPLAMRQALRSMMRPGNSSQAIVITLASALAVLLTIYLVERNLRSTYIASYPPDAPNLFCLDIQPSQQHEFAEHVGMDIELFPVIRARLTAINSKKVSRTEELKKRGDSLAREFNLTYRQTLLDDELLVEGDSLFGGVTTGDGPVPVSVLDNVAEMGDMKLGDILHFNIQGVPLVAEVVSIRSRTKSMLYPFFYFVFPEEVLQAAPQTLFGALKVDKRRIAELENSIVGRFPNISTVNVGETAAELGKLMAKLARIINFFASFSILAGGLILVSSILATRLARIKEAVYYKILGSGSWFVLQVFFLENLLLALMSGGCAILVGQAGSWAICRLVLEIDHDPGAVSCMVLLALTVFLVVTLGLLSSITIIRRKPISFLREQV